MKQLFSLNKLIRISWAAVLVCLPVTSFRYFPFLGKETMVRPLAFYPLAVLVFLLSIRWLRDRRTFSLPGILGLLGLFLATALASSVWGLAINPVEMHGMEYTGRVLRAWVTLIGGMVFLVATIQMNRSEADARFTFKWLMAGLALSFIWGAVQFISYQAGLPPRAGLNRIQMLFSTRKLLVKPRITGFAYEPSWLANQVATVYLPWLIAALLSGYRIMKKRFLLPLLLSALFLLVGTFSRSGIIMALTAAVVTVFFTQRQKFTNWARGYLMPGGRKTWKTAAKVFGLVLVFAVAAGLLGYTLSTSKYFSQLWQEKSDSLVEYAIDVSAGPRLAYAVAGFGVYTDHPLTGVGLGASGFTLYDHIPDWSITTTSEITRQLTPNSWLYPNPKNLYIRILAETGLPGFILYLVFWLGVLAIVIRSLGRRDNFSGFIGLAGLFSWIVLIFFNFTQDSFIDPNQWLSLVVLLGLAMPGSGVNSSAEE